MEQQNQFEIYNKSSERMEEVKEGSIDLIVADPPWNMSLQYGVHQDNVDHDKYLQIMGRVISGIDRTLRLKGLALFVLPRKLRRENRIYNYPEIFTKLFNGVGFQRVGAFDFSITEEDFVCLPETELSCLGKDGHSREIQILAFTRSNQKVGSFPKDKHYIYIYLQRRTSVPLSI